MLTAKHEKIREMFATAGPHGAGFSTILKLDTCEQLHLLHTETLNEHTTCTCTVCALTSEVRDTVTDHGRINAMWRDDL